MREIKFRGKDFKNNWLFGSLIQYRDSTQIGYLSYADSMTFVNVNKKTIGQFTGLTDKNGVEIYEGDFLKRIITAGDGEKHISTDIVKFSGASFCTYALSDKNDSGLYLVNWSGHEIEVVGNIHDNPELLQ